MNVFLIGYRGTGKTTVAQLLAHRLHRDWADSDSLVEMRVGKTIREIFAEQGEAAFRDFETAAVRELASRHETVIALGGGAILRPENRDAIRASGTVVWLKADPRTLFDRIQADESTGHRRPNLTAAGGLDEIRRLVDARAPYYQQAADVAFETTDRRPEQVADEIFAWLESAPASRVATHNIPENGP